MSQKDHPPVVEKVTTLVPFISASNSWETYSYIYINTHLIAEFYNITGVCSTITVNAQLQTDQCEQAGIPPLVQGYSKLHLWMRITSCLRQTWPSVEVCSLLLHCISHSIWLCLFCPDMLDYLLERPDPAVQNVEDLLNIYENPYKVVPTAGEFLNSRNTTAYCPIPTEHKRSIH